MAQNTETPPETLAAATDKNMLATNSLALVGTFDKQDGPSALIRTASGTIQMVAVGDKIGTSTVMGVEMGVLHLARAGTMHRLTLPDDTAPSKSMGEVRPVSRPANRRG